MKIGPKRGDYIVKRCDTLNNDQLMNCERPLSHILNSRVRKTNRTIDKISKDIELLRSNIKTKVSSPHFKSITDVIYKSKEKLFRKVKQCQVRKFKHLQESPTHQNTPVPEHISKKWVINLASKDLSPGEVKLLQRGPNSLYLPQRCLSLSML